MCVPTSDRFLLELIIVNSWWTSKYLEVPRFVTVETKAPQDNDGEKQASDRIASRGVGAHEALATGHLHVQHHELQASTNGPA